MSIFEKVKGVIAGTLNCEPDAVTMEASISEDLGADSLSTVELIMALEDEFGISLPDEDVKDIKLVGDVVALIESRQ